MSDEDKLRSVLDAFPTRASIVFARSERDDGKCHDDGALPPRVVIVLQFWEDDEDPVKRALYNRVKGRQCGEACEACKKAAETCP